MTSVPGKGLRFESGYVHKGCGGDAERAMPPYKIAFCKVCDMSVPMRETEKKR